jgi:hypothetical protein
MANPNQINQGGARNQERQPREQGTRVLSEGSSGEARTPDRRIGQVAHADDKADDEAQRRRKQMSDLEKADGEMPKAFPDRDPAKKKTGEF